MSQEITFIGSILIADTPGAHTAYQEMIHTLDLDSYDDISLTPSDAGLVFDISITEWITSVNHAERCHDAIVDFTTKHSIAGSVFKTGPEDEDILCLGACGVMRREGHVQYLEKKIAHFRDHLIRVNHSPLSSYTFESEK